MALLAVAMTIGFTIFLFKSVGAPVITRSSSPDDISFSENNSSGMSRENKIIVGVVIGLFIVAIIGAVIFCCFCRNVQSHKPSGIVNVGNTCYLNSMLQALSASNIFFRQLIHLLEHNPKAAKLRLLREIIEKIKTPGENPHELADKVQNLIQMSGWVKPDQQDSFDLLSTVINSIEKELNIGKLDAPIPLKIRMRHEFSDPGFGSKLQLHLGLSIALTPGVTKLEALIENHFKKEYIDDDPDSTTNVIIYGEEIPEVLLLHIQANQWNPVKRRMEKPHYNIVYKNEMTLKLPIYSSIQQKKIPGKNVTYELRAVVVHMGGVQGGHYIACREYHGEWFQMNDQMVKKIQFTPRDYCEPYIIIYDKKI